MVPNCVPKEEVIIEAEMKCPPATQDVAMNTKNRNSTIENHMCGNLNVDELLVTIGKRLQTSGIQQRTLQRNHFVVTVLHLMFHHAWKIVCSFRQVMMMVTWVIVGCITSSVILQELVTHGQRVALSKTIRFRMSGKIEQT